MLKYLIIPVSIIMLALSSCSVDCKVDCTDSSSVLPALSFTEKDVDKDKCDDCTVSGVSEAETLGYDCSCSD